MDMKEENLEQEELIHDLDVYEGMKDHKHLVLHRIGVVLEIAIVSIATFSVLIFPKLAYLPKDRDINTDNVYQNTSVIIPKEKQDDILASLEEELNIDIPSTNNEDYFLLKAIHDNPHISKHEKDILYQFIDYFIDNPYINNEEIYTRLLNVDTQFSLRDFLGVSSNTLACYVGDNNDIVYFSLKPSDTTIAHEGGHCITGCTNIPKWLDEGMTQLIVNEYFEEDPFNGNRTYYNEVMLVKFICELIGTDPVLQAYTKDDMSLIYKALGDINGTPEEALEMLNYLDVYYSDILDAPTTEEFNTKVDNLSEEDINHIVAAYRYLTECVDKIEITNRPVLANIYANVTYSVLGYEDDHILCKAYISSHLKKVGYEQGILITPEDYKEYKINS